MSTTQIKNTFTTIGELDTSIPPASLMLQLAVSETSIRYFIRSISHNQVVFYGSYLLHHVENKEDLIRRLEKIHRDDEMLQLGFGKVVVGIDSYYTPAPGDLSIDVQNPDGISYRQKFEQLGLELNFAVDMALNYKLKYLFPDCTVEHVAASFLSASCDAKGNDSDQLFINLGSSHFDIIRFTPGGHLQLMNRYEFKTSEDLLYFLLLVCEQLQINREKINLVLSGNIEAESSIYTLICNYFLNTGFAKPGDGLQFSKAFDVFPKHQGINLYNLGLQ